MLRPALLLPLAVAAAAPAAERPPRPEETPVSGKAVPALAALDEVMLEFMRARDIRAGTLCVARDQKIVFERGYGWRDAACKEPLPPDAPMRIASLAKPITNAVVFELVLQGKLTRKTKVFELLEIEPHGEADERLADINVGHLLDHKAGWDRKESGDPVFMARRIAADLKVPSPPDQKQVAAWVFGQPLDFDPGERRAYSNFGFLLLGLVIEKVTGSDATAWARKRVMGGAEDFALGRSLPADRDPGEPEYYHPGRPMRSAFGKGEPVAQPDGSWPNELMECHGGWRCSARTYTDFLTRYWIGGARRQPGARGYTYDFRGSLPGTWTVARQRLDGVSYAAFFNQRTDESGKDYTDIVKQLDAALAEILKEAAPQPAP